MGLPSIFKTFPNNSLVDPGDKFSAEITKKGRQVIKLWTKKGKRSAVRYPKTGTIVVTIVYKGIDS